MISIKATANNSKRHRLLIRLEQLPEKVIMSAAVDDLNHKGSYPRKSRKTRKNSRRYAYNRLTIVENCPSAWHTDFVSVFRVFRGQMLFLA
jgi:hypothetical protein